jgi:hypothetical protein
MQNKPNFGNDKMNIIIDMTSHNEILHRSPGQKTKPIQTQFKPNKAKNKANLSQFQSQTNPTLKRMNVNFVLLGYYKSKQQGSGKTTSAGS